MRYRVTLVCRNCRRSPQKCGGIKFPGCGRKSINGPSSFASANPDLRPAEIWKALARLLAYIIFAISHSSRLSIFRSISQQVMREARAAVRRQRRVSLRNRNLIKPAIYGVNFLQLASHHHSALRNEYYIGAGSAWRGSGSLFHIRAEMELWCAALWT